MIFKVIFVPRGLLFLDLQNVVTERCKWRCVDSPYFLSRFTTFQGQSVLQHDYFV